MPQYVLQTQKLLLKHLSCCRCQLALHHQLRKLTVFFFKHAEWAWLKTKVFGLKWVKSVWREFPLIYGPRLTHEHWMVWITLIDMEQFYRRLTLLHLICYSHPIVAVSITCHTSFDSGEAGVSVWLILFLIEFSFGLTFFSIWLFLSKLQLWVSLTNQCCRTWWCDHVYYRAPESPKKILLKHMHIICL